MAAAERQPSKPAHGLGARVAAAGALLAAACVGLVGITSPRLNPAPPAEPQAPPERRLAAPAAVPNRTCSSSTGSPAGFPVKGILYVPHMVGEPYPRPEASPQDVYDNIYSGFHKRDLPIIGSELGMDTLLMRPWTLSDSHPKDIFKTMGDSGICKMIPTFHVSKYYAELLLNGGTLPDTDSNSDLFKDFVRFGSTLAENQTQDVKVVGWTVDLSLDLESLLQLPLDVYCVPEPTEDKNYRRYKAFMEILIKWVRQTGEAGSIAPALAQVPLLLPLDISRASYSGRDVKTKLRSFLSCMPQWAPILFEDSVGVTQTRTRWLFSFALPYQDKTDFFRKQLQLVSTALKSHNNRAVIVIGAQALKPDPVNVNKVVEDFGNTTSPAQQQYVVQTAQNAYAAAEWPQRFDGLIVDEWQDDWDRGGRGPFFLALNSLDEMRQVCKGGGRFSHDDRRCARNTGPGVAYPEFFGFSETHSSAARHCMRPRFHGLSGKELPMQCIMVRPSRLWVFSASAIILFIGLMHVITRGCVCCSKQEKVAPNGEESNASAEKTIGQAVIEPRDPQLRGNHNIRFVSTRFRSDTEAGWWLSSHLSVQQNILEKQVMAELSARQALHRRQNYLRSTDSEATSGSETDGSEAARPKGSRITGHDLQAAMATLHRRALEGFAAWALYVSGALKTPSGVDRQKLKELAQNVYENEDRDPARLFAEAVLLRAMESLSEQILHCPERLAYLLYTILADADRQGEGPSTYLVDFEELQGGLKEMNDHSNPYERRRAEDGRSRLGINFDDINECGIQCRDQVVKTYKEPASVMVMFDFFLCYRVPFMIKVWGLYIAAYIYLGSGSGNDLSTSHNGTWYKPEWMRINFLQYTAMGDAALWAVIEASLVVYKIWQRFPSLGYRTPGVPSFLWFLEHLGDLAVSVLAFLWMYGQADFRRKPTHCIGNGHDCNDARSLKDIVLMVCIYWATRAMVFMILHRRHDPIFLHGTPWRDTRAQAGRTCSARLRGETVVNFAWLCMLATCIVIEVYILLPAMKGLSWNGTCGFDAVGRILGFPEESSGACSRRDHWTGFACTSCVTGIFLAGVLVFLTGMVDIYFVFYGASALFGSVMGQKRQLNDLKNTATLVDLRPREGREAKRFESAFGPGWRQVWMQMVQSLWEESYISPQEFVSLVEAAGLTADGQELVDRRNKKMKPIALSRFPRLAGERLAFFFHSLKSIDSSKRGGAKFETDTDALTGSNFDVGTVPSLTQIIPAYNECVIPAADFLKAGALPEDATNQSPEGLAGVGDMTDPPKGSGVNTNLAFMISQFPNEWVYLAKRLHSEGLIKDPSARTLYRSFMTSKLSDEVLTEVRIWSALRCQTVYKTVIGALAYARALASLPAVRRHYSQFPAKRLAEDHVEVILAHQTFGMNPPEGNPENDENVKLVLSRNSNSPLYLVFDLTPNSSESTWHLVKTFLFRSPNRGYDGMGFQYAGVKCKWDPATRDLRVVEVLPRKYPLRIGKGEYKTQGKAGNQLNGLRFASGYFLQALDCNMGAFIGEGFKVPYVLRTFMPLDTSDRVGTRCRYLGFREYIYTGREGTVGKCHASSEWTFGTIYQRFLSGLGTRMHYGHPDFVDGFWARNRGGMSKSSAVVNLSEDIFAGYNVRMREEGSPHTDLLEFEKGREASFNAASNFFSKISGGSVALLRSRDNHLLCERIGLSHALNFYFSSVAFYTSNLIVDISTYLYVFLFIFFTLANIDLGRLSLLGSSFGTEWIVSMGVVSLVPQLFEMVLEFGAIHAIKEVIGGFAAALWFYIFQNKSISSAMRSGAATGTAKYLATGRPMANQHQTWKDAYISYIKSHYQPACTLLLAYLVYILIVMNTFQGKLPMMLIVISFTAWFITPVVFCPFPRWSLIKQDLVDFNGFINGRAGMEEEELPEVIDRGSKIKVRTLFECGLADEIFVWGDHPVFVLVLYVVMRIGIIAILAMSLPSGITDYVWIYAVILSCQWVFVFGFFAFDLNNILLIASFLVWPFALLIGQFVLGTRASTPSIMVRMPEYVISLLLFLYVLGLAKQITLLCCRLWFCIRRCMCPSMESEAKKRMHLSIRSSYVYFFVHQQHCVLAYWILIVNLVVSCLLTLVDLLPGQPHTWWLLNAELARTKRSEENSQDKLPSYLDLDDQRTSYNSDTSSEGGSDTSSESDNVDARSPLRR